MPSAHPFKRLHGNTRQHYVGGIYNADEISHFVGRDRMGPLYPFMMAGPRKPSGKVSPTGPNIGILNNGQGA